MTFPFDAKGVFSRAYVWALATSRALVSPRVTGFSSVPVAALLVGAGLALSHDRAEAACTDPPAPGVDWQRCSLDGLDLSGENLEGARLRESTFLRGKLIEANLKKVSAHRVKFISADLTRIDLTGANLSRVDFTKADMTEANLSGADLRDAKLFRANLTGANLSDAQMRGADLTRADFSGATWTDGKRVCKEGSIGRCN